MKFTKMHGLGNDYVYVNCFEEKIETNFHKRKDEIDGIRWKNCERMYG